MYDERYVSRGVNEGIYGINFPASGNNGLSVVKGCLRNTHVVKYWHMMITWKPPIIKIEQALGCYVASFGKYVLGVIRDIYWIDQYQCIYRTKNPVVWDSHPYMFTCFSNAGSRYYMWQALSDNVKIIVGNGRHTQFWTDCWLDHNYILKDHASPMVNDYEMDWSISNYVNDNNTRKLDELNYLLSDNALIESRKR
ncbi:hypothetical protein PIB30_088585 [Stylosanthes scabra]|uniref:Uncharacterized protein n=1 Tax=Stylosanthes scabra TaxID=79078 RepID=A0ABU6RTZ7_9FABA|nr:hypothetical protein [Stylosanthes scabra]